MRTIGIIMGVLCVALLLFWTLTAVSRSFLFWVVEWIDRRGKKKFARKNYYLNGDP